MRVPDREPARAGRRTGAAAGDGNFAARVEEVTGCRPSSALVPDLLESLFPQGVQ